FARALAKRPEDRYESALAFAVALGTAAAAPATAAITALDEPVRDAMLRLAPQPLADAIAVLDSATDGAAAWRAIGDVIAVATPWLGVLALCGRIRVGGTLDASMCGRLERLREHGLDDAEWLALARDLCRPFADKRDVFPIPELVGLLVAEDGRDRDPFAPLL